MTSTGAIETGGDVDWFSVYLLAGEQYSFRMIADPVRGFSALASPHLYLWNQTGTTALNDSPARGDTASFSYVAPASGIYMLAAKADGAGQTGGYVVGVVDQGPYVALPPPTPTAPPVELTLTTTDYQVSEDAGVFHYRIDVTRSLTEAVTIRWQVSGYGQHPTQDSDFQATSGTVTLQPGLNVDHYGFNIVATNDDVNEADEDFRVTMSVVSGSAVVDANVASGTILNDDAGKVVPDVDEPNVDFDNATPSPVNTYVRGYINTVNDTDYFKFHLQAGATYQIAVIGSSQLLPQPATGPVETGNFALQHPEGELYDGNETVALSQLDPVLGGTYETSSFFTPTQTGDYYLEAKSATDSTLGQYYAAAWVFAPADDFPASTSTTGSITPGVLSGGDIERSGDVDWLKVSLDAGRTYNIFDLSIGGGASTGFVWQNQFPLHVAVYDGSGAEVAGPVFGDQATTQNVATFTPAASGDFFIAVASRIAAPVGNYWVGAAPAAADPQGPAPSVLQPSPTDGKEAWLDGTPTSPVAQPQADHLQIGFVNGSIEAAALKFDISGLPQEASSAYIELYCPQTTGRYDGIVVGAPLHDWPTESPLNADKNILFESVQPVPGEVGWYKLDVTQLYNAWRSGAVENDGVSLFTSDATASPETFLSESYADPSLRPKLVVYDRTPNDIIAATTNATLFGDGMANHLVGSAGDDILSGD